MPAVAGEVRGAVDGAQDLGEGDDRQIRHPLRLRPLLLLHAPDDEEGLPVVLVRRPVVLVRHAVDDLCDHVHEGVDLRLQHLGRDGEVADPAHADDAVHPGAGNHRVDGHGLLALHVVSDDVGARLAEAEGEQGAELDDGLLQDQRLHRLLLALAARAVDEVLQYHHQLVLAQPLRLRLGYLLRPELVVGHLRRDERVVADGGHVPDHLLYGPHNEAVRVVGEQQRPENEQHQEH
mmetsp:Transcript_83802/g.260419  ORF Transcript_83802/g.260419 Transcript_83802/m.260419 type:complete len:235 (+) Transcript_83802:815-1519(+)